MAKPRSSFSSAKYLRKKERPVEGGVRFKGTMLVLLVEDHTDTRSVVSLLLNRCGCRTVTAKNVKDARARLQEMPFDVLISDLTLPDGEGVEVMREAKKKQPPMKAIALTGRAAPEERLAGLEAGFDHYLTKPIDFQELRQVLRS